jgi:hypothetical protein
VKPGIRPPAFKACFSKLATALLLSIGLALPAQADGFRDPEDGEFDISDYLLHRKGVMPVPIVITEPAATAAA